MGTELDFDTLVGDYIHRLTKCPKWNIIYETIWGPSQHEYVISSIKGAVNSSNEKYRASS